MAANKQFRNDKRTPSFYVMATIAVFIALCLIGMWFLSTPTERVETTPSAGVDAGLKDKSEPGNKPYEESPSDTSRQTEGKFEESFEGESPDTGTTEQEKIELTDNEKEPSQDDDEKTKNVETETEERGDGESSPEGKETKKEPELELIGGEQSEIQIESKESAGNWDTQANESKAEREKVDEGGSGTEWQLCNFEGATDYIPCLDNKEAIKSLPSTKHYEHRERHCPSSAPICLVPLPKEYRTPIKWPKSRNEIWYSNVPHPGLVSYKKDQNWVKKDGDKLVFPGGGTQFKHGALHYIEYLQQALPDIAWGNHTRVILDVGCGVASFGGYIFDKGVLTMSFAPKDEHEAQIQLALERGIPAISAVMGTQRLPFPSNVFDAVHCARCRVPWHIEGGKLLLELNRVLRPGGYFLWSATPVYWHSADDEAIWTAMEALTKAMCWELVVKSTDESTAVGVAIFRKTASNECYENREETIPPMCDDNDKADAAWYIPMTACMHKVPSDENVHGVMWPPAWPLRLTSPPVWFNTEKGLYGRPAAADFQSDLEHWQRVVSKSYLHGLDIDWTSVRNVMDMNAVYGGFAAALVSQPVWVMNVVPNDAADTLPIIYDRGLFGMYHDWCESFSSYPRTYDLLHSNHLFDKLKKRCDMKGTIVEMDRLLRPQGWAIFRDKLENIAEIEAIIKSLHWDARMKYGKETEGLLVARKMDWRPSSETV